MVLLNNIKYACETCIKGHRSSACKHTDRPLFEIKKKGRPVTQCEHCRELRKTKQVHVKCICEVNKDDKSLRASSKSFDCATFPNGLPEALEASVAPMSDGTSSDSEHSGCNCQSGGSCSCCTPRTSAPSVRKKKPLISTATRRPLAASDTSLDKPPPNILARIAELRPVLPKLPQRESFSDGPTHIPSVGGHPGRHHAHEDHFFSPYGRAYDHAHSVVYAKEPAGYMSEHTPSNDDLAFQSVPDVPSYQFSSNTTTWTSSPDNSDIINTTFASPLCGCGDDCLCPGCSQHSQMGSVANLTTSPCANPSTCGSCFNCAVLAVSLPADTALSIYQPVSDDWMQQFSPEFIEMINAANTPLNASKGMLCFQSGQGGIDCRCPPGLCICGRNTTDQGIVISGLTFPNSGAKGTCMNDNRSSFLDGYPEGAAHQSKETPDIVRSRCSSTSSDSSTSSIHEGLFPLRTSPETAFVSFPST